MSAAGFEQQLRAAAEVMVRVGLNLQPGQRLLVTDPYELQGVARGAAPLVESLKAAAVTAGAREINVIWGDAARLRRLAENKDWRGLVALLGDNAALMREHVQSHDALLFLQSSQPRLLAGVPASAAAELRRLGWEHFGPVAQELTDGASNWTVAPAPTAEWAEAVHPDLPAESRVAALWADVFSALRVGSAGDNVAIWRSHLSELARRRDELNARRPRTLRYTGGGTDLTVRLAPDHVWCTAQLATKSGLPFVANLPTDEIFTAPDRDSAEGTVRVSRPVSHAGEVIEGIGLTFRRGRIVEASATSGADTLEQLLATDEGACRLGEVALVPAVAAMSGRARHYYHPLLDENAANHVALGEAYPFTARRPDAPWRNRSLIHLDLPLDARPVFSD